ncbi:hypothetical protein JCM15765_02430 [Paradesulfitobacterium aromaticivorans]
MPKVKGSGKKPQSSSQQVCSVCGQETVQVKLDGTRRLDGSWRLGDRECPGLGLMK